MEEQTKSIDQLVRGAMFLPYILGPAYRQELTNRLGFEITQSDVEIMKLACDQFAEDHNPAR